MARILITIPTWNESVVIGRNLRLLCDAIRAYLPQYEVLVEVADNGSTDGTRDAIREFAKTNESSCPVQILEIDGKGKGAAIRSSWKGHLADADVLAFTDADLAADISALPALVGPVLAGKADLVCGSRYILGSKTERGFVRSLVSKLYRVLQRAILKLPVQDAQCGFKAISKSAAAELLPLCREDAWMFDTELIALAVKKGKRIVEVPVDWIEHRNPQRRSALRVFRDGWGFLAGLWRIRRRIKTSAS